ncbi:MAG: alpha-amylase family glycosyl hydrolase [Candidatus Neomarinimicrobiota bacterium]
MKHQTPETAPEKSFSIAGIAPAVEAFVNRRREFHVSRAARERFQLEDTLFALDGNLILVNLDTSRKLVERLNAEHDLVNNPDQALLAADLNALGLIDEILHYVVARYREQVNSGVLETALDWLETELGRERVDQILETFITLFPPTAVFNTGIPAAEYLRQPIADESTRALALEELLLHWLANDNPAFSPFRELFDDSELEIASGYRELIAALTRFFESRPGFGPRNEKLIDLLRSPALAAPNSLTDQLNFLRENWADLLGTFLLRLLRSLDFITEETRYRGAGPGPATVLEFGGGAAEYERFSPDSEWMPRVVMLAKNALVWLDQLSRTYRRPVERLDQIPDEELDRLAEFGFTALWLIGLWKRSRVSQKIKQWCGNPEAESSAYSLKEYIIADALGGPVAFENLKQRCWQRGIRLASDMVPNHTGLDAGWLIEHPDWYVQTDQPPFPAYKFESENLAEDERISIQIENHYYDRTDAAVVFRYVDRHSGQERFIYHGNDGTSMPWNDTAQLNYLLPQVREAVLQTILHVARQTPIIRFDAAMTLAKRHFQRLWFPEPGSGGDIPSRAEHGLTKAEFDRLMPQEFWREVVDRVAAEVPHTLLLAEAFWMMEGYFVRTLGMHRVYNSAFMNMLKMENNDEYRQTIKNTLEFDPQILKRFVNFLNNPDEETAAVQFGTGDKYFGITLLMLTMPGLPMFGHGQIEGFREKYGMEFRRAYWEEFPDENLLTRHQRDIFPVLRKRYLFAEVENFRLFDLYGDNGAVNENVFAYSNSSGRERALVLYNNSYQSATGWIRQSAAFNDKTASDQIRLRQDDLATALALHPDENSYLILHEQVTDLQFIRRTSAISEQGFFVTLSGYQYQIFWDLQEVHDNKSGHYGRICDLLSGGGVPSIDEAIKDLFYKPVRDAYASLLANAAGTDQDQIAAAIAQFTEIVCGYSAATLQSRQINQTIAENLKNTAHWLKISPTIAAGALTGFLSAGAGNQEQVTLTLRQLGILGPLCRQLPDGIKLIDELGLDKPILAAYRDCDDAENDPERSLTLLRLLCRYQDHLLDARPDQARPLFRALLDDGLIHGFLGINSYGGVIWFNQEGFEELVWWLWTVSALALSAAKQPCDNLVATIKRWLDSEQTSGFRLERLLDLMQ